MSKTFENLQAATSATFGDMKTIGGLGVINYVATMGKMMLYPVFAGSGLVGGIILSSVDGMHDLVRFYFIAANGQHIPDVAKNQVTSTTAG